MSPSSDTYAEAHVLRLELDRIFLVGVAQLRVPRRVAELGVVVERHLAVERQHRALLGHHAAG
jgi:hypothetical protein